MEPLTMFAFTVGFIGAFHLLSQAVEHFGKGINRRGTKPGKREDWYCFFELSDLLGYENKTTQQANLFESEHLERVRKQQTRRPRLYA